jgi:hypothetical protein
MGVSKQTIAQCRQILENLAKSGDRITYSDLMTALRIGRQSLADCLNPIYQAEISAQPPRPDLTLIPHYSATIRDVLCRTDRISRDKRVGFALMTA